MTQEHFNNGNFIMKTRTILFFMVFAIFFSFPQELVAKEPLQNTEVFEKTETYKVFGIDEKSIRSYMKDHSPCRQGKEVFDASTTWYVEWFFKWQYANGMYHITEANSNVEIKYIMPQWPDKEKAHTSIQEKWECYFKALSEHEFGHRNIAIEAAKAVNLAIIDIPPGSTSQSLEISANAAANRVLERYRTQEREYDRQTDHGKKTGAVFP
jgi:predicted secreted Zn-dependent protease